MWTVLSSVGLVDYSASLHYTKKLEKRIECLNGFGARHFLVYNSEKRIGELISA